MAGAGQASFNAVVKAFTDIEVEFDKLEKYNSLEEVPTQEKGFARKTYWSMLVVARSFGVIKQGFLEATKQTFEANMASVTAASELKLVRDQLKTLTDSVNGLMGKFDSGAQKWIDN